MEGFKTSCAMLFVAGVTDWQPAITTAPITHKAVENFVVLNFVIVNALLVMIGHTYTHAMSLTLCH